MLAIDERNEQFAPAIARPSAIAFLPFADNPNLSMIRVERRVLVRAFPTRIERPELLPTVRASSHTDNLRQGVDLEVAGAGAVGDQMILMLALIQMDAIDLLWEEIDRWGAEELEVGRANCRLDGRIVTIQQDYHFKLAL